MNPQPTNSVRKTAFGNTGMQVSVLGLGAAEIGFERVPDRVVDSLLGTALDLGINVIDTAAMYADSEKKIGKALSGKRDRVFLFTKCGLHAPPRFHMKGLFLRSLWQLRRSIHHTNHQSLDWHPRVLKWNIEQSLRRLKTECIDLIQLHSCSEETLRQGEVIEVLQRARDDGKVRHIGYSADQSAALYAVECGHFEALQISVNIADQRALEQVLPRAIGHNIGVIAKRPLANLLWRDIARPIHMHQHTYWDRLRKLRYGFLQSEHAVETALKFALSISGVHTAIVGTTNPDHLRQNAKYVETGFLNPKEFRKIRARWVKVAGPDWTYQV